MSKHTSLVFAGLMVAVFFGFLLLVPMPASTSAAPALPVPTATPLPPDTTPRDGRINWQQADPFVYYCNGQYDLLQVYVGPVGKVYEFPFSALKAGETDGGTFEVGSNVWSVSFEYAETEFTVTFSDAVQSISKTLPLDACSG